MSEQGEKEAAIIETLGKSTAYVVAQWEERVRTLEAELEQLRPRAALAVELRSQEQHTVFWWADYLEDWRARFDALPSQGEGR